MCWQKPLCGFLHGSMDPILGKGFGSTSTQRKEVHGPLTSSPEPLLASTARGLTCGLPKNVNLASRRRSGKGL